MFLIFSFLYWCLESFSSLSLWLFSCLFLYAPDHEEITTSCGDVTPRRPLTSRDFYLKTANERHNDKCSMNINIGMIDFLLVIKASSLNNVKVDEANVHWIHKRTNIFHHIYYYTKNIIKRTCFKIKRRITSINQNKVEINDATINWLPRHEILFHVYYVTNLIYCILLKVEISNSV